MKTEEIPPFTKAAWARRSETYAEAIVRNSTSGCVWLDAGCGKRILEEGMDELENWLLRRAGTAVGVDPLPCRNMNISEVACGSIYSLPFADNTFDIVTCNMVVEHLEYPLVAFREVCRCLKPGSPFVFATAYLRNYGVLGNKLISSIFSKRVHDAITRRSDGRPAEDIFPVRYRCNTRRAVYRVLRDAGLTITLLTLLRQNKAFFPQTKWAEKLFMKLTPHSGLIVCAKKLWTG